MKNKNQQCNLYLPTDTVIMLDKVAAKLGKPRSELANDILVRYLEQAIVKLFLSEPVQAGQAEVGG